MAIASRATSTRTQAKVATKIIAELRRASSFDSSEFVNVCPPKSVRFGTNARGKYLSWNRQQQVMPRRITKASFSDGHRTLMLSAQDRKERRLSAVGKDCDSVRRRDADDDLRPLPMRAVCESLTTHIG